MAGHSKGANIKHRKGAQDAIKSRLFQRLAKEISVAAARGGSDPDTNAALRLAITKARARSMPKSNIERAIKSEGVKGGNQYREVIYSCTVSSGITVLLIGLTDNHNRLTSSIQATFNKYSATIGKQGSIPFMFHRLGILECDIPAEIEERLLNELLIDDVLDISNEGSRYIIHTRPQAFENIRNIIAEHDIVTFHTAEITFQADTQVTIDDVARAEKFLDFIEQLESNPDIQEVFHNADLSVLSDQEE